MKFIRHENSIFLIPTFAIETDRAYEDNTLFSLSLCFTWLDWTLWITIFEN